MCDCSELRQKNINTNSLLINCIVIELIDMKVLLPFKMQFQGKIFTA